MFLTTYSYQAISKALDTRTSYYGDNVFMAWLLKNFLDVYQLLINYLPDRMFLTVNHQDFSNNID